MEKNMTKRRLLLDLVNGQPGVLAKATDVGAKTASISPKTPGDEAGVFWVAGRGGRRSWADSGMGWVWPQSHGDTESGAGDSLPGASARASSDV